MSIACPSPNPPPARCWSGRWPNIERAVTNFRRSGAAWLIGTTFPELRTNTDCEDGDWRALNFERPPFEWRPAVALLNEDCQEAGGGWGDKSLGVWRVSEIG